MLVESWKIVLQKLLSKSVKTYHGQCKCMLDDGLLWHETFVQSITNVEVFTVLS